MTPIDKAIAALDAEFHKWADEYIRRQYPFYNKETCASVGEPLKRSLHDAWKAGIKALKESVGDVEALKIGKWKDGGYSEKEEAFFVCGYNSAIDEVIKRGLLQTQGEGDE